MSSLKPLGEPTTQSTLAAELKGEELHDLDVSLWSLFTATSQNYPHREAIVSLQQSEDILHQKTIATSSPESKCVRWTYNILHGWTLSLADALQRLGCAPSTYLVSALWNSAEWCLFFWASTKIGMTIVPLDPRSIDHAAGVLSDINAHVVVVPDADAAADFDLSAKGRLPLPSIRIHCSESHVCGWLRLRDLFVPSFSRNTMPQHLDRAEQPAFSRENEFPALLIFTSGTTGSAKACLHTNRNLVAQTSDYDPNQDASIVDRWLVHTPLSHIFAINNVLRAWRYGGTVVIPSRSFDVCSTLQALTDEKCTIMAVTPTLVKAIVASKDFSRHKAFSISVVSIAGTDISVEDIHLCKKELGAQDVIQAYGMTEGAPLVSWSRQDAALVNGYHSGVGRPLPGVGIRVCKPGTHDICYRTEIGELHVSGPAVISQYFGGTSSDSFYVDEKQTWFITGDRAKIDNLGVVHILGRFKDLIIRGGENIHPSTIERALQTIDGVQAQVVGIPDHVAGQVPVAVVTLPPNIGKAQLFIKAQTLGHIYRLSWVYTLDELGLSNWPTTSVGKPNKGALKAAVLRLQTEHNSVKSKQRDAGTDYEELLSKIWDNISGMVPAADGHLSYLADSITLLRYCDMVLRETGTRVYLQDFKENNTISKQAQLLRRRKVVRPSCEVPETQFTKAALPVLRSPSSASRGHEPGFSSVMLMSDHGVDSSSTDHMASQSAWSSAQNVLQELKLEEAQIEDIIPIREVLRRMVRGQRPQSHHIRVILRVKDADVEDAKQALAVCLASYPLFRSILCNGGGRYFHAVVASHPSLLNQLISHKSIQSTNEADAYLQNDDAAHTLKPQYMFHAVVIQILDTQQLIISTTFNHSAMDAVCLLSWHNDLDCLLNDPHKHLPPQTLFKLFADLFEDYKGSLGANDAVRFHVQRLRGISRFKKAMWPPQQAPGWMIGNDTGSEYHELRKTARQAVWKGEWDKRKSEFAQPRRGRVVRLPQLCRLRERLGISPALFTKSALVLFNTLQTGSRYAILNSWESGRSWPFVRKWMHSLLPPPMSIAGPTAQWMLNMAEVIPTETVTEFLVRMREDEEQMLHHIHGPWERVVQGLGEEGPVAIEASFRQSFVWDVSMGIASSRQYRDGFEKLEPVARYDWADCGLFWNAFMIDKDNVFFIASWDTAQMHVDEIEHHCDRLADVMRRLGNEENWDNTIAGLLY